MRTCIYTQLAHNVITMFTKARLLQYLLSLDLMSLQLSSGAVLIQLVVHQLLALPLVTLHLMTFEILPKKGSAKSMNFAFYCPNSSILRTVAEVQLYNVVMVHVNRISWNKS